jgi:hypothetical protein
MILDNVIVPNLFHEVESMKNTLSLSNGCFLFADKIEKRSATLFS